MTMTTTTWRELLADRMAVDQDPGPVEAYAPDESAFVYDGAGWLGSAPRHPRPDGQRHVGGE